MAGWMEAMVPSWGRESAPEERWLEVALLRSPLPKAADRRGDAPAALPALAKGVKAGKGAKPAKVSAKAVVKAAKVAPKRKGVRAH